MSSNLKYLLILAVLFLFLLPVFISRVDASSEETAALAITQAEETVGSAYEAVLEAERDRANVSELLDRLNVAGEHLAEAHMLYRLGNFDVVVHSANLSSEIGEEVRNRAEKLKTQAYESRIIGLLIRIISSIVGIVAVVFGTFITWRVFKRRYFHKQRQRSLKLDEFRILFLVAGLVLTLIVASPVFSLISLPKSGERFSELWLLGPGHKAEDYPFNVRVNEEYSIYAGVSNQLGELAYYAVYLKFCNQTQQLPNSTTSEACPLPPLYEFRFILFDGNVWEDPLTFAIDGNSSLVQSISINGMVFPVNCTSTWDSNRNGFYYQMFFELWLYNITSSSFQYHNRFVGLWLNMTSS